ncbi:MAG TPA: prepilin peptidase, partial [Jatrophihabitans sp.]|nr:prepilin peptidase [Jatrophihabitans sp.]
MPAVLTALALLGLAVGSFLNVLAYRLPAGQSLLVPASRCPCCEHPVRPWHNVPVFGWLLLRGRCADCRSPISPRYPVVELATCGLFVTLTYQLLRLHQGWAVPGFLYFAAIAIALALIDLDTHRLPNAIVLPSYLVLGLALTLAAVLADSPAALVRALIGGMGLYGLYFVLAWCYPKGMGFGDVKLAG